MPVILPPLTFAIFLSDEVHVTVNFLFPYLLTVTVSFIPALTSSFFLLKTGAFTTFTLHVYFLFPFFHVILAFPVFFAVTTPSFVTVASFFFDDLYLPLFSFAPFTSMLSLSPMERTQSDTDSFTAACAGTGTDGTAITTAKAAAALFNKCFLI